MDTSHLPPGLNGASKHRTGTDITVLGLWWRGICSNQAGWSTAGLAKRLTLAPQAFRRSKTEVSHTAWMRGYVAARKQQRIVSGLCPRQTGPQAAPGWWAVVSLRLLSGHALCESSESYNTWNCIINRKVLFPDSFTYKQISFLLFTGLKPLKRQFSGILFC